jgi:flavin reductase (DIM6/NTAB) family NADH-FMN oxidoreductase RutF/DNA-binding IclR family transcriptional regulator
MVVGTFSSVSLDPPLVSFMPDHKSTTWPEIRKAGSFCANILPASHEEVCLAFTRKRSDRFDTAAWAETASGNLRLDLAMGWFDCTIDRVFEVGDHDIVIGRVEQLGVGRANDLPLLFLRGGYGSFTIPSIQSLDVFLPRLTRAVDAARPEIEALARELNLKCLVTVAAEGNVVVASAAGAEWSAPGGPSRVGVAFPLAAPFAPVHVAWSGMDAERRWLDAAQPALGAAEKKAARTRLDWVRTHGYGVSTAQQIEMEFERMFENISESRQLDISGVLSTLSGGNDMPADISEVGGVTSIHAPVFGPDGEVGLSVTINGFDGSESPGRLRECLSRLLLTCQRITERSGGKDPRG